MAESVFGAAKDSDVRFEMCRKASFSKLMNQQIHRQPAITVEGENKASLEKKEKMWKLMESYLPVTTDAIQRGIVNHVEYTLARTRFTFDNEDCYRATAYSIRDRLIETLNDTVAFFFAEDVKRCYYLSLEYLLGRAMQNALVNLDIEDEYKQALMDMGYNLEELYPYEHDPALGNGGLGRLAACFLDSMATLNLPCWGYGIRYTYGIFEQKIVNGRQVEHPDYWLVMDNPWEICRHDITYAVRFYGEVKTFTDPATNQLKRRWLGGTIVQAVAYDNPIPGFDTYNCINLRLWKATPSREFDFNSFNAGLYLESIAERQAAEAISAVLYPNDNTTKGKMLRLQQQYFFCCATIQDVLRRFKRYPGRRWEDLPSKVTMQLNDTHPTVAIPELMRILVDVENLDFDDAWGLTQQVFNYTNHTVLPEALEKWPQSLFETLLPRHLLIINDINFKFLNEVRTLWGQWDERIGKMSVYEEGWDKKLRMANLAIIGSKKVNGVAAIHTDILKRDIFKHFREYYEKRGQPLKIVNKTNGVTPRRWIHCCNRRLSHLMSEWIGSDHWLKDLSLTKNIMNFIDRDELRAQWREVKLFNKRRLAEYVLDNCGVVINPETMMFDIQVKRIHEYKRQLLNLLYIIHRYLRLKKMTALEREQVQPRACMIGGKAAPGYLIAKTIIKMANTIADVVNNDPDVDQYLKVVFLPNYNVSSAMIIIPASDISHQISTAGTEASGTSCMKFVMNGGLIIGTLDGANIEIIEECGEDTVFVFGLRESEIARAREDARNGRYPIDPRLAEVFDWIRSRALAREDHEAHDEFMAIVNRLTHNGGGQIGDFYLVCRDFPAFCDAQAEVDTTYQDSEKWTRLSIKAASSMGKFSSDRTIRDYAEEIWEISPCERKPPPEAMYTQAPSAKSSQAKTTEQNYELLRSKKERNNTCEQPKTVIEESGLHYESESRLSYIKKQLGMPGLEIERGSQILRLPAEASFQDIPSVTNSRPDSCYSQEETGLSVTPLQSNIDPFHTDIAQSSSDALGDPYSFLGGASAENRPLEPAVEGSSHTASCSREMEADAHTSSESRKATVSSQRSEITDDTFFNPSKATNISAYSSSNEVEARSYTSGEEARGSYTARLTQTDCTFREELKRAMSHDATEKLTKSSTRLRLTDSAFITRLRNTQPRSDDFFKANATYRFPEEEDIADPSIASVKESSFEDECSTTAQHNRKRARPDAEHSGVSASPFNEHEMEACRRDRIAETCHGLRHIPGLPHKALTILTKFTIDLLAPVANIATFGLCPKRIPHRTCGHAADQEDSTRVHTLLRHVALLSPSSPLCFTTETTTERHLRPFGRWWSRLRKKPLYCKTNEASTTQ